MTLEEYLTRYRLLQRSLEEDERMLSLMNQTAYAAFLRRFGGADSAALSPFLVTRTSLEKRLERRGRLCLRYAERIALAASRIYSPVLRRHALNRYLFGMTFEDIARETGYSLRTVYRQDSRARLQMQAALRAVMPRPRRCPPGRFFCARRLPRRDYTVLLRDRTLARCRGEGSFLLRQELRAGAR